MTEQAEQILAVDVGTQSVRALVFDAVGVLVAGARIPIEPYVAPQPGWAEQDPELYWRTLGSACRQVLAHPAVRRDAIAGMTVTTQRNTVVVTDADGKPLRPAIVWLDQRRTAGLPFVGGATGLAFRALGLRDTVGGFMADCEANWLRANEPETWRAIRHYLYLSGFLHHRLTGRFIDSSAVAGRLRAVRLQAPGVGRRWRLEVVRGAGRTRLAARARPPDRAARIVDRTGGPGDRIAGRPAGDRRGG